MPDPQEPLSAPGVIDDVACGRGLGPGAAAWFADALASGAATDAQAGAFAMAVRLRGLSSADRAALTLAMRDTGHVLEWDLPGPVVDKHSTGGVGDCVSLVLAPALAACGVYVPMISGRGLGHTGGTLDKLESIPGLTVELDEAALRRVVDRVGCAIVAASRDIAPADRRLYSIRDVTATVPSLDLIVASILSKKLAAGIDGLILDVKTGSGAFMSGMDEARALARALVDTANQAGCPTTALVTAMDEPLAPALGNAVEVAEVMTVLEGAGGPLAELSVALGAHLLGMAGIGDGEERLRDAIASGAAMERFGAMVHAQGGAADFPERWREVLPVATILRDVAVREGAIVQAIDGKALGMLVVRLGGGRLRDGDRVDPSVGLSGVARLGARLGRGDVLARIHAADEASADRAEAALRAAVVLGDDAPQIAPLVRERITT